MLDLDRVGEVFAASTDATVGLEEEFALLDPATLDMVARFEQLRDSAPDALAAQITGELIASEIEIVSGRGETLADAVAGQRAARTALFAHAAAHGVALGATGTHPWADYREQPNIDTDHYRRVVDGLQYVARRNNTFSLHVHVGVRDIDRAVAVCDRLRPVLPLLLALSANSPWMDARDSGLHSARTQMFTRTFPRCGIPDAYGSWAAYRDYIELLKATGSIVEYTQVWWSVRPHFGFGTVEVRMCDAQSTAQDSEALAAMIVACVLQAARDHDEGRSAADRPRREIEENLWRAIRFGLDGRFIDLDDRSLYDGAEIGERLMAWTAPVRAEHGIEPRLPARNGAQRQRRLIADGGDMHAVYAAAVAEAADSYPFGENPT